MSRKIIWVDKETKEEFDKLKKEKGMTQDGLVRNGIKLSKKVKK